MRYKIGIFLKEQLHFTRMSYLDVLPQNGNAGQCSPHGHCVVLRLMYRILTVCYAAQLMKVERPDYDSVERLTKEQQELICLLTIGDHQINANH